MHRKNLFASAVLAASALLVSAPTEAQEVLTGDIRLACEAILCLSSGNRPTECTPSLQRYFSISYRKLSDTIRARTNFLQMCPASNQTPEMTALVNAMANGAGRCDADSLNATLRSDGESAYIGDQMPPHCFSYPNHGYTELKHSLPRYVGTPQRGGHWADASDYDRALAAYSSRIAAEDAAARATNE